jgi:hypothetical protein
VTEETAATEIAAPEDEDRGGGRRLSAATWTEIDTHWECGTMTAAEMARHYGVSPTALSKHFARCKDTVKKDSKKHLIKKAAEVKILGAAAAAEEPLAVAFEQKRKGRIAETREHGHGVLRFIFGRTSAIAKEINDKTRKEAECANDLKALRHMQVLTERNIDARLRVLKADQDVDESEMPALVFRDLSQEEITAMANADLEEEFDLELPAAPAELADEDDDSVIEEGVPSPSS